MKNIYKKIFFVLFAAVAMISCEDEDKSPLFVDADPSNDAVFVTIAQDPNNLVIDFTKPESSYNFTITAPANNVAEYDLIVIRTSNDVDSEPVSVQKVTSFPFDFSITRADLAAALGVAADDLKPGDQFSFVSTATGTNGVKASFADLNGDATGPGQFQGFNHTTFVICPFITSEAVGTYSVTSDGFGGFEPASATFEVTAGANDGEVIVTGLYDADKSFTISMNTELGIATIDRQPVANSFAGYAGGNINTNTTTSFFFSCTGTMILNLQHTVDLGSFGNYTLKAKKN
ncbi:hypothetical protein [Aquimarina sediminis]|uniref:hypothetical protein n=1 Tax=Aquimarina sediminis TaxID=2070536 RepID=UPI000CA077DC|nr:hypothetical protein [Aquimarina sediminis]